MTQRRGTHARVGVLLGLLIVAAVAVVVVSRSAPGFTVLGEADALAMAEADFGSSPSASAARARLNKGAAEPRTQHDAAEKAADSAATKLVDEAFARAMAGAGSM